MALSGNTFWEIRPGSGSDNNGGGFLPGSTGTDFSQQNSAQYNGTDLIIGATNTTLTTTSSHTFGSTDVGNILHVTAGTNFTQGFYQIVSVTSGVATMDRAVGTASATGGTYAVGGALATIGQGNTIATASNQNAGIQTFWVKATASISTASQITWQPSNGANLIGYTTTRGDNGQVTILLTSSSPSQVMQITGAVYNFIINGQTNGTGVKAFNIQFGGSMLVNCKALNFTNSGFASANQINMFVRCVATACGGGTTAAFNGGGNGTQYYQDCIAYACPAQGFQISDGCVFVRCIAANNTGSVSDGFNLNSSSGGTPFYMDHCLAYGNGRDGLRIGPSVNYTINNSIFYGNAGFGFNDSSAALADLGFAFFDTNAYGGNTSGNLHQVTGGPNDVTLTADPTTAGASNNFALNSTSGGGAACKAVGYPGVLSVGGTGFADIGPLQSSGGGGGTTTYVINKNTTIYIEDGEGY